MSETARHLELSVLRERLAISRLAPDAAIPEWATRGTFFSITRNREERSIVAPETATPPGLKSQGGWSALKAHGPFAFSETGIAAALTAPLADAKIGVFLISTFDTDYLLVAE